MINLLLSIRPAIHVYFLSSNQNLHKCVYFKNTVPVCYLNVSINHYILIYCPETYQISAPSSNSSFSPFALHLSLFCSFSVPLGPKEELKMWKSVRAACAVLPNPLSLFFVLSSPLFFPPAVLFNHH